MGAVVRHRAPSMSSSVEHASEQWADLLAGARSESYLPPR
jgi:hypothetical protein